MKKKIGLIIVLLVLVVLTGGCLNKKESKTNKETTEKKDYGELVEITYSDSGDMNGNIDAITIDVVESTMKKEYSTGINEPIAVTVYNVKREEIEKLAETIIKYDLPSLSDLPLDEEMMPLDASTPILTFTYDKEGKYGRDTWYSINFYTKIPDKKREILNELVKSIRDLEDSGVIVNKYTEDRNW